MTSRPRVAFVVARCGDDVVGGAEALCLTLARLAGADAEVEILTTRARDYRTWRDDYPAGVADVRGVRVRRFGVDRPRDPRAFDRRSRRLAAAPERATASEQEAWRRAQGPCSRALATYVRDRAAVYDTFVFFGYLYATTTDILPLVAHKAVLVPLAHDEWPLRLPLYAALFAAPRALAYVSDAEAALVRGRFPRRPPGELGLDVPIEAPAAPVAGAFRARFGLDGPFALALGRIDAAKGVPSLVRTFARYRRATGDPLQLVLAGSAHARIPAVPGVVVAGALSETEKWDALAACELLIVPSEYESLSLALLEAWACGKPALVNARSSVLVAQCRRAQGGVWYASDAEFAAALRVLDPHARRVLGEQGRRYVAARHQPARAAASLAALLAIAGAGAREWPVD